MVRINLTEENLISTTGIADRRFADHSGDIQHGYQLGSLTEGLVAYYPMEKGQGQVLHDGAFDNLGQNEGGIWATGNIGSNALDFNGLSTYANIGKLGSFGSSNIDNDFTVTYWVKVNTFSDFMNVVGHTDGNNTGQRFMSRFSGRGINSVEFYLSDQNGTRQEVYTNDNVLTQGTWHHVVISKQGPRAEDFNIYVDGVEESLNTKFDDGDISTANDLVSDLYVGAVNGNNGASNFADATIEEFRIYDRALSQPEIEALAGLTEPSGFLVEEQDVPTLREFERDLGGAVSRYEFEGDVTDSWGDNDGTDNTSAGFVDGVFGQAKDFDGNDDLVSVSNPELPRDSMTASCWSFLDDTGGSTNKRLLNNRGSNGSSFDLYVETDSNDVRCTVFTSEGIVDIDGGDYGNNEIHHTTFTYDGDRVVLYVDGVVVNSDSSGGGTIDESNEEFEIGVGDDTFGDRNFWSGWIDDVRVYSKALTPIEVETLFNKGAYRIKRGNL